jgi:predicted PurR-regulated permease PerM
MFGLLGLVYGPLIFGLCAVLLSLYRDEFADALTKRGAS